MELKYIRAVFIKEYINFKFKNNLEIKITTENYIYKKEKSSIHSNLYKINPDIGEIVEIVQH